MLALSGELVVFSQRKTFRLCLKVEITVNWKSVEDGMEIGENISKAKQQRCPLKF